MIEGLGRVGGECWSVVSHLGGELVSPVPLFGSVVPKLEFLEPLPTLAKVTVSYAAIGRLIQRTDDRSDDLRRK
jgi:hypothetical protein